MLLAYTNHSRENHSTIAGMIRDRKPSIYFAEGPESLAPLFCDFLADKAMTYAELERRFHEAGWRVEGDSEEIYEALRELGCEIAQVESDEASRDYGSYRAQASEEIYILGMMVDEYALAKKGGLARAYPRIFDDIGIFLPQPDPEQVISEFEARCAAFAHTLEKLAKKELDRDRHMVARIKELHRPGSFGYFGYCHRTISHLLSRDGIAADSAHIGRIVLSPEDKLNMLLKYGMLGIESAELRHEAIERDVDASAKSWYLELIPYWGFFLDMNVKKFPSQEELIVYFWNNLDKILR